MKKTIKKIIKKSKELTKCMLPMSIASMLLITIMTIGVTKITLDLADYYEGPLTVEAYTRQVIEIVMSGRVIMSMMGLWSVLCMLIHGIWYKKKYAKFSQLPTLKKVLPDILTTMFMFFGVSIILELVNTYVPILTKSYTDMMDIEISGGFVIYTVLMAPIAEEYIFRGLTQSIVKKRFNVKTAIVFQAVLFGLMHMNLVQGLYAFGMGLYLGKIKEKYDNILIPIFLHIIFNSINYIPLNISIGLITTLMLSYLYFNKKKDQKKLSNEQFMQSYKKTQYA